MNVSLTISGNIGGAGSLTKNGPGTVTLSGSNTYTGSTSVNAGTLVLNKSFTSGLGFTIASGARARLVTSASLANPLVLKSTSLAVAGTGALDLNNNAMIVDYSGATPLANIRSLLQQGYAGGAWTGNGMTSSVAASIVGGFPIVALGYAEASSISIGAIPGQIFDQTSIVIRYTLVGDANLDQVVNSLDFTALASSFDQTGRHWFQGDFNYDGVVNALDFNAIASNFGQSLPAPVPESLTSNVLGQALPEPAALIPILGGAILWSRSTRKRRA
jgi:autotransporter-associated beta strand protein